MIEISVAAMNDTADPSIRRAGAEMLASVSSLHDLLETLHTVDDPARVTLLELFFRKGFTVQEAHIAPFLADTNPRARLLALKILSNSPGMNSCRLVADLISDHVPYVRRNAMRAVSDMDCMNCTPALTRISREGDQEDDRYEAHAALFTLLRGDTERLLLQAFKDPSAKVRNWAAEASRTRGTPHMVNPLLHILQSDISASARAAAAHSLANWHTESQNTVEQLGRSIRDDSDSSVRIACAHALSAWGSEGLPHLLQATTDLEASVRRAAVIQIKKLNLGQSSRALKHLGEVETSDDVLAELVGFLPGLPLPLHGSRMQDLYDPGNNSKASTTWLSDLTRYPASSSVTFYATGKLSILNVEVGGDSSNEISTSYEFSVNEQNDICIAIPNIPDKRTRFSIAAATCTDMYGNVQEYYKLTLSHWGPPFRKAQGSAHFFTSRNHAGEESVP
ncbi:HEAT repeat domain-containing protein [Streptomyces sp. NPDC048428]|uniref:HEAT repeat domain-containing protein n=1 Tax=Streptomyces sp. NPDC048428 TaxID=3154503 RepID=UPI00341CC555